MTTIIIGGGLIGLCTAKSLLDRGESVRVLEAREDVGLETSFANGGMLTPSLPEPWNDPGVHRHLMASLFDPKSSMKLRPRAIPALFFWGIRFLRNSTPSRYYRACADNFRLATYSLAKTRNVAETLHLEFSHATGGTLSVFRNAADLEIKQDVSDRLAGLGMRYRLLDRDDIVALEPSLGPIRERLSAGIHFVDDEFGDAHLFCRELARELKNAGVPIDTGVCVKHLISTRTGIGGVRTDRASLAGDRVVVAAGVGSRKLLRAAGIRVAVQPAKGYSVTIDVGDLPGIPRIPVLDDTMHAGVTPLDRRLRLVGTAEFTGFDTAINPVRVDNLFDLFEALFPALYSRVDRDRAVPWAGLRPMSADGRPLVGPTAIDGLYVNTGHGHLGWTMAMGSAELLADLVLGRKPEVDPAPFAPSGR